MKKLQKIKRKDKYLIKERIISIIIILLLTTHWTTIRVLADDNIYSNETIPNQINDLDRTVSDKSLIDLINIDFDSDKEYVFGDLFKINILFKSNNQYTISKGTEIEFKIPKDAIDYDTLSYYPKSNAIDLYKDRENNIVKLIFNQEYLFNGEMSIYISANISHNDGKYNVFTSIIEGGIQSEFNIAKNEITIIKPQQTFTGLIDPFWYGDNFIGKGNLVNGTVGGVYLPDDDVISFQATYNSGKNYGPYNNVDIKVSLDTNQILLKDTVEIIDSLSGKDISSIMNIELRDNELIIGTGNVERDFSFVLRFSTKINSFDNIYTTQFEAISNTGDKGGYPLVSGFIDGLIGGIPRIIANDKIASINTVKDYRSFLLDGVVVKDIEDGNIPLDKVEVDYSNVDWSNIGTYPVTYTVIDNDRNRATKTINVTIRSNDKPVIEGAEDIAITQGDIFKELDGITANDTEDGNITDRIIVSGVVNTNIPGKYELIYSVKDNDGNITEVERIVTVNPKLEGLNHIPTIDVTDRVLTVGDIFNPLEGVTANDHEDGEIILTEANIVSNNVDMSQAGVYQVTYKVTDSKGASATKTITITVNPKLEDIKLDEDKLINGNKPGLDKNPNYNNQSLNRLPNTGAESSLPILGALSLIFGTVLSFKKKNN